MTMHSQSSNENSLPCRRLFFVTSLNLLSSVHEIINTIQNSHTKMLDHGSKSGEYARPYNIFFKKKI